MEGEPEDWLDPDYLERLKAEIAGDPELRLLAEIGRRVGAPLSEVQRRWTGFDLAVDVALSMLHSEEDLRRCPRCGIDPDTMLDRDRRQLAEHFTHRIEVRTCSFCLERDELAARVSGHEYQKPPPIVRYVPRQGDEPFADEGLQFGV